MRQSGILLHITSLPSLCGIGDLGPGAYAFLEFLKASGQSIWQVLPLNPTDFISDHSPYSSCSAFAGNPLLISPEVLVLEGLLSEEDIEDTPHFSQEKVEFDKVSAYKQALLDKAFTHFHADEAFKQFLIKEEFWLKDYALYCRIKKAHKGISWVKWPEKYKERDQKALEIFSEQNESEIQQIYFEQYLFYRQWKTFHEKAEEMQISIMGDIPMYVDYDSADVWANPKVFKLNKKREQEVVAGVPPDYFSKTGQRWGNPVYDWAYLQDTHFDWWMKRLKHNLSLCDILRIDHFRALVNYWEIPAKNKTAVKGYWVKVPTEAFFKELQKQLGHPRIVAEDLGQIDPSIMKKIHALGFPGMKILMFAFSEDLKKHMYLPHNYEENCVAYTGTHDNNTARGWFDADATPKERSNFLKYIFNDAPKAIHLEMIRLVLESKANLALIPMQDVLGLGRDARMNTPGTGSGNWRWRLKAEQMNQCLSERLAQQTRQSDR